jgi:hypothetical protein
VPSLEFDTGVYSLLDYRVRFGVVSFVKAEAGAITLFLDLASSFNLLKFTFPRLLVFD